MIKAIITLVFLLFSVNGYALGIVHLKDFSILSLTPTVDNIIFTFDRIDKYRFIMLNKDYWYIAAPGKIMSITTPLIPKGNVRRILVRIIKGETRIFFKMNSGYQYKFHIVLSKNHHFLIVRVEKQNKIEMRKSFTVKKEAIRTKTHNVPVIVIDPGHGGKDPGAIGLFGLEEKNITLSIGKYVTYFLRKDGYRVYMTRTSDTYPTLADRVRLANRVKADVFVSIHANYAPTDRLKVKGLEVYFLNTTSDRRALELAARENGMSMSQIGYLNRIILSLIQTTKIKYSKILASDIYHYMLIYGRKVYKSYVGRGIKQAPFYVLVGTRCPSVLVETAFINNPSDATFLGKDRFRRALAKGIAKGIELFLKRVKISFAEPLGKNLKS